MIEQDERIRMFDGPTLIASAVLFVLSLAYFIAAVVMADPSGGANIGAGLAAMGMVAAASTTAMSVFIAGARTRRARTIWLVLAWVILAEAAKFGLLFGWALLASLFGGE